MEVVRLAALPLDRYWFTAYDKEADVWSGPPGVAVRMNWDMEKRLNFTTQILFGQGTWGKTVTELDPTTGLNVTKWLGIIGMLGRGEADWSPDLVSRTWRRAQVVDYSQVPYDISELLVTGRIPQRQTAGTVINLLSVLQPFQSTTWFLLLASWLLYAVLLSLPIQLIFNRTKRLFAVPLHRIWKRHLAQVGDHFAHNLTELLRPALLESFGDDTWIAAKSNRPVKVLHITWLFALYLLAWGLYGGELISYMTHGVSLDFIKDYDDLKRRILEGTTIGLIFSNGWVILETDTVLGREITPLLAHCPALMGCLQEVLKPWEEVPKDIVYIHSDLTLQIQLLHNGARALPYPALPSKHYGGEELYSMGRGHGVGLNFFTTAYSRHSPHVKRRFEPWLRKYFENGCFQWWDTVVDIDLRAHYRARNALRRQLDYSDLFTQGTESLSVSELYGTYVACGLFAACALLAIGVEQLVLLSRPSETE